MRLGFVTNIPNPYNESLFAELRTLGHQVTVLYARSPSAEGREWHVADHGSEHVAINIRRGHVFVRDLFKRADAVIVSGSYLDPMAIEALVWARRRSHPVLFWGEPFRGGGWRNPIRRALFARLDGVLTVGRRAEWGYRQVTRANCAMWNFPYVSSPQVDPPCRVGQKSIVGFAGALIHRKGLDLVIDALAELEPSSRPLLEVAGSGPDFAALSALAIAKGVIVQWLGFLQKEVLRERQRSWTLQVVPSRYDGWGVVVNEALSAGLPVLVSEQTGAGVDLVRSDFNGDVIYSAEGWAPAISRRLTHDCAAESEHARTVGRSIASDRAAAWLVQRLESFPRDGDFIEDAFAAEGARVQWNRLVTYSDRDPGLSDSAWRVAVMSAATSDPASAAVSACLSGLGVAVPKSGTGTWALSRSAYEGLAPLERASLVATAMMPPQFHPAQRV